MSYKWFIGMWAWDSWKADVATADFNPELAKNNMRALFDYQIQKDDTVRPQDAERSLMLSLQSRQCAWW